jgi:hypothetical protein
MLAPLNVLTLDQAISDKKYPNDGIIQAGSLYGWNINNFN